MNSLTLFKRLLSPRTRTKTVLTLLVAVLVVAITTAIQPQPTPAPVAPPPPELTSPLPVLGVETQTVVTRVVDGDTIEVTTEDVVEKVRLIGINTPETVDPRRPVECFGAQASAKMKELALGKAVILEADPSQQDQDKYQRLLRYVFLKDGTNINLELIKQGFAYEYTYDQLYLYQAEFKAAQAAAQQAQLGLWSPTVCLTATPLP